MPGTETLFVWTILHSDLWIAYDYYRPGHSCSSPTHQFSYESRETKHERLGSIQRGIATPTSQQHYMHAVHTTYMMHNCKHIHRTLIRHTYRHFAGIACMQSAIAIWQQAKLAYCSKHPIIANFNSICLQIPSICPVHLDLSNRPILSLPLLYLPYIITLHLSPLPSMHSVHHFHFGNRPHEPYALESAQVHDVIFKLLFQCHS